MPVDLLEAPAAERVPADLLRESREFFADEDAARRWFRSPMRSLGGRTPEEAAATAEGARAVRDIFVRVRHGVVG